MRPAFPRRSRLASSTACSALVVGLALAGCGGGGETATGPALPSDLGAELEAHTTDVEEALADGDAVRARAEADELVAAVRAAIESRDVPGPLREELLGAAERLAALVPEPEPEAPPPPPPPPDEEDETDEDEKDDEEEDDDDEKDGKGKGKGRGKGEGKD